jgi:hypothetical protein
LVTIFDENLKEKTVPDYKIFNLTRWDNVLQDWDEKDNQKGWNGIFEIQQSFGYMNMQMN